MLSACALLAWILGFITCTVPVQNQGTRAICRQVLSPADKSQAGRACTQVLEKAVPVLPGAATMACLHVPCLVGGIEGFPPISSSCCVLSKAGHGNIGRRPCLRSISLRCVKLLPRWAWTGTRTFVSQTTLVDLTQSNQKA